jgi:chaperonin GroES
MFKKIHVNQTGLDVVNMGILALEESRGLPSGGPCMFLHDKWLCPLSSIHRTPGTNLATVDTYELESIESNRVHVPPTRSSFTLRSSVMAKSKIQPLADRVLVKRLDDDGEQKVGGIIIPDTAKEKPQEAEVVAVGPGKLDEGKRVALEVKKGDKVLIGKYSGTEVKLDGEEHLILREEEILAVIS